MGGYKPKEIANGDEMGLFFVVLSSKTLCLKGEKCSGGKLCKKVHSFPLWFYDWRDGKNLWL
jgi:hypothetical protein